MCWHHEEVPPAFGRAMGPYWRCDWSSTDARWELATHRAARKLMASLFKPEYMGILCHTVQGNMKAFTEVNSTSSSCQFAFALCSAGFDGFGSSHFFTNSQCAIPIFLFQQTSSSMCQYFFNGVPHCKFLRLMLLLFLQSSASVRGCNGPLENLVSWQLCSRVHGAQCEWWWVLYISSRSIESNT